MYAQLCKRLSDEAPNFEPANHLCSFRVLLLNKCRAAFENRTENLENGGNQLFDEEERRLLAKRKMLGNIKFIGELGKLEILSESILHRCIQELLKTRRNHDDDPSEDLECLCQIMRTCGRTLDSDKGKELMEQYFKRMALLADKQYLAPRIRFMLKDVIDLRYSGWMPRKATIVEGPMPIHQIRSNDDDRPGFRRDKNQERDTDRSNGSELFRHPMKTRGGIEDMFMGINLNTPAPVIPTHHFSSNGYGNRDGGFRGHNQRSGGFNNYNNQRGQYKHNQNNSNTQFNNQSNKEVAPRFKKNFIVPHEQNLGEVELRPSNYMLFNKATIKANNMMNSRPLEPPIQPSAPKQATTLHKETVTIKPASAEKPKQAKKDKGPNKEEVLKKFATLLEDYLKGTNDLDKTIETYKEHKVPEKFYKEVATAALNASWEKTDEEKQKIVKMLTALRKDNLIGQGAVQDSLKSILHSLEEQENEITKATASAAVLFANVVVEQLTTLADLAALTDNGAHYPLFLLVLQNLHKMQGKGELTEMFNNSKVNLMTQLPENDRTKERMAEILEERDLTFLYPLLRIQAELSKQLQTDPNPQRFYKWIKENLDAVNYTDPGFINALMTVLLKYITQEAAGEDGDKAITDKEKSLLESYRPILQSFLHEQPALQLVAVYSLQVHFYAMQFPKGQLLRWFRALYDLEIVEEEAFLKWKEDVTDAYPGKGQALFQVNQWLTWLEEAESEEDEEGDE